MIKLNNNYMKQFFHPQHILLKAIGTQHALLQDFTHKDKHNILIRKKQRFSLSITPRNLYTYRQIKHNHKFNITHDFCEV